MLTALEIIQATTGELALTVPEEVFSSTEATSRQMLALLKSVGDDLVFKHDWTELQVSYTFQTVPGQNKYSLPADYYKMVGNTMYDSKGMLPITGGTQPADWAYQKARNIESSFWTQFKIQQRKIVLYPTPTDVRTVSFDYQSNYWILDSGTQLPKAKFESNSDYTIFNDRLMVAALKLRWLQTKGLETSYAVTAFETAFDATSSSNDSPPTLSITPECRSAWNFPETGFGAP